jgi:hypothetical protein
MAAITVGQIRDGKTPKRSFRAGRANAVRAGTLIIPMLVVALASVDHAQAQEVQTLFGGRVSHGGFGGPGVKFSDVRGELGVWVGGRGGWIINFEGGHSISLGGGGYGLATTHPVPDPGAADVPGAGDLQAHMGYGGFELEYTHRSDRLLHWTASTLVGAGAVAMERAGTPMAAPERAFFVLEPGLHGELNVATFMRLHGGLTYRLTRGVERAGFTDRDFSGVNGALTLKFGRFR